MDGQENTNVVGKRNRTGKQLLCLNHPLQPTEVLPMWVMSPSNVDQ